MCVNNESITFVVPVNDENVYSKHFLASPLFKNKKYEILSQRGFASASKAYNDAIDRSDNDIMVFTHQDMSFPDNWERELFLSISYLKKNDPNWGVIGCYGKNRHRETWKGFGYLYCAGNKKILGEPLAHPVPVQTLDEIVIIFRKSTGLRFDELLPHFHFYGTDICMISKSKGMNCYAISAFCIHNTKTIHVFPEEFFECYKYIKRKWYRFLPIESPCIRITRHGYFTYIRKKYLSRVKYRSLKCLYRDL